MAKYHINSKGNPGSCTAKINCPFGGAKDHFDSLEEARDAVEIMNKNNELPPIKKKAKELADKFPIPGKPDFYDLSFYDYKKLEKEADRRQNEIYKHDQALRAEAYQKARAEFPDIKTPAELFAGQSITGDDPRWLAAAREYDKVREAIARYSPPERAYNPNGFSAKVYAASRKNRQFEAERILKVLAVAGPEDSAKALLKAKKVSPTTNIPQAVKSSPYAGIAYQATALDAKTREKFYSLPTKYYATFINTHESRPHADAGVKALIEIASEMHEKNPEWQPQARYVVPRAQAKYSSGNRRGKRVGEAKDMQFLAPVTYSLLEDTVKNRFGEDRADEFWTTVQSDSANKPKLSDFFRALKKFQ